MVGQEQHDDYESPEENDKVGGVIMAEDDLEVGQYVCVYNLKKMPDEGAAILGQSLQVKAICLPYFVGQLLSDPAEPVLTLDCRYLRLMRVTNEFVQAQRDGAKGMNIQHKRRKDHSPPE